MHRALAAVALFAGFAAALAFSAPQSVQAEKIGYQSGIDASVNAWIATDPAHKAGYEKLRRTLKLLAADYDGRQAAPPPPPPPPATTTAPPPPAPKLAPQTYNKGSRGQDARYCVLGLPRDSSGAYVDGGGYRYDEKGLSLGGRSGNAVSGLKPADEMDGREPCDPYTNGSQSFPPWPEASYQV